MKPPDVLISKGKRFAIKSKLGYNSSFYSNVERSISFGPFIANDIEICSRSTEFEGIGFKPISGSLFSLHKSALQRFSFNLKDNISGQISTHVCAIIWEDSDSSKKLIECDQKIGGKSQKLHFTYYTEYENSLDLKDRSAISVQPVYRNNDGEEVIFILGYEFTHRNQTIGAIDLDKRLLWMLSELDSEIGMRLASFATSIILTEKARDFEKLRPFQNDCELN